jgi:cytoskeletal protein CcmA (bactofilin family)
MFPKVQDEYIPEQRNSSPDEVETVVGPSVHVEGDFASEGNIIVKGMVSGNVKTEYPKK